jgi:hypothetical protein
MVRKFVKAARLTVQGRAYPVKYFEISTPRGLRRFSAEILLGPADHIILDDDSMVNLEARAMRLVPATLLSRLLARATAA